MINAAQPVTSRAQIIVFGNEKGGSGKSTAAMHVAVGLLRQGYSVAALDLDSRQGTLSRYFERRCERAARLAEAGGPALPCPSWRAIHRSDAASMDAACQAEHEALEGVLAELVPGHDVVVIDTPGSDNFLSRLGHSVADTLITPINDSFVDLDLLARIDPDSLKITGPSIYAEMVWEQRKHRMRRRRRSIDWIVMRNRLGHTQARNKQDIAALVEGLKARVGFRTAAGFGERVIFRELFLKGLTLMDLKEVEGVNLTMSHLTARQEVLALLDAIGLARPGSWARRDDPVPAPRDTELARAG